MLQAGWFDDLGCQYMPRLRLADATYHLAELATIWSLEALGVLAEVQC